MVADSAAASERGIFGMGGEHWWGESGAAVAVRARAGSVVNVAFDWGTGFPYDMGATVDDDELHFCWDDGKAAANLEKHGVSFETATYVFDDRMRLEHEDVFAEGEYRNIVIGRIEDVLLTVVYSTPEDDLYRIISARPSTANERKDYERNLFQP
jgi:hypothetical protein